MNGTITTWFQDKGFGFIKDENGDNRYFHVIKVSNPDLIKKDAAVTFEPTTNTKGLSAYAVKVIPESASSSPPSSHTWSTAKRCPPMRILIKKMRCSPSAC